MVERLFGGKLPVDYDKPAFSLSHRIRRFSLEKTSGPPLNSLGTICEGTDEPSSKFSSCSSSCSLFYNDSEGESGLSTYRKARAISLPVIYRDGSYLKLETHIVNMRKTSQTKQRRFSAPSRPSKNFLAVPTTPELQRFPTHRKSTCQNQISDKDDTNPLKNTLCASYNNFNSKQFRRHSDPLPLASFSNSSHLLVGSVFLQSNKRTEQKVIAKSSSGPRRKSSVVPVPFSIPLKKKVTAWKNRPISFPPAKDQQEKIRSLKRPEVFLPETLRKGIAVGNEFVTALKHPPLADNAWFVKLQEKEKKGKIETVKEEEINYDDFYSRAENIVQWINFFG